MLKMILIHLIKYRRLITFKKALIHIVTPTKCSLIKFDSVMISSLIFFIYYYLILEEYFYIIHEITK